MKMALKAIAPIPMKMRMRPCNTARDPLYSLSTPATRFTVRRRPVSERGAFAVAFYASGVASVLLVAPSVHQRLRAPATGLQRHSERHLTWATWLGIVGSLAALVAISATVYLVSNIVFNASVAISAAALTTALACWSWLFLPLVAFRSRRD